MYGLRSGPWRFSHGVEGVTGNPIQTNSRGIPEVNITDIAGRTDEGRYLALTDATRERESEVYRGLRYSQANLSTLDSQPGVHLVQSNGEFDLYFIAGSESGATNATAARTAGG